MAERVSEISGIASVHKRSLEYTCNWTQRINCPQDISHVRPSSCASFREVWAEVWAKRFHEGLVFGS